MAQTYDVRVWEIQVRWKVETGRKKPLRYVVRWMAGGERFQQSFKIRAQADAFRSELLAAAKKGEPFDPVQGLPLYMLRVIERMSWVAFARDYVDMKWADSAPKSRKSTADNLVAISRALLPDRSGRPDSRLLGKALMLTLNPSTRDDAASDRLRSAVRWAEDLSPTVAEIADPAVFRALLSAIGRRSSGERCAPNTIRLRRTTLRNALDYAVERRLLEVNPLSAVRGKKNQAPAGEIDERSVVNPMQARTLLLAVRSSNPRLVAFFGVMYYAALRPEEAVNLRRQDLVLPTEGWGELHLRRASPEVAAQWTDSGTIGEERELKHRGIGVGRTVPCAPDLVELLREHLREHGTASDGRLFHAMRSDAPLSSSVYGRTWARAREATFTAEVAASPLARRPYDLRHAAVSTWLNATGDPTRVAEWAGHTVSVLLRVYAKCLDGGERDARKRVAERLLGA
jgi:integrase